MMRRIPNAECDKGKVMKLCFEINLFALCELCVFEYPDSCFLKGDVCIFLYPQFVAQIQLLCLRIDDKFT
jgi:hypothetical protein